jgi:serine/threonine protein kinase
MAPQMTLS